MPGYTIGVDYGTLSGRAVLADVTDGRILGSVSLDYPHGVMDRQLPDGRLLPQDWALQHPRDYLDVLEYTVPRLLRESAVRPEEVLAIGVDVTAATPLPVTREGVPLCFLPEFRSEPHAYAHLWKHHAAQKLADRMTQAAAARGEKWLDAYGGKVSCETALPKLWQVLEEAPDVYYTAAYWVEAADWIIWQLCGKPQQSACSAGFKYLYCSPEGYPSEDYFAALDLRLRHVIREKCSLPVIPLFSRAGYLLPESAARLGLRPGTAVAASIIDAHAGLPAAGITEPGEMVMILGTSACFMICDETYHPVSGCYAVKDGILPGLWSYEAGQNSVGDAFAWMLRCCVPASLQHEAETRHISVHEILSERASAKQPGETGLLALDWFNGNRSILMDSALTGMILGLTLQTAPEDIYRAIAEAIVCGARTILDHFRESGVAVRKLLVTGGISRKNHMMMQMYADMLNMPVYVPKIFEGSASGTAMTAAAAAEAGKPGGRSVREIIRDMAPKENLVYVPDAGKRVVYDRLFRLYTEMSRDMAREGSVMKKLLALRSET